MPSARNRSPSSTVPAIPAFCHLLLCSYATCHMSTIVQVFGMSGDSSPVARCSFYLLCPPYRCTALSVPVAARRSPCGAQANEPRPRVDTSAKRSPVSASITTEVGESRPANIQSPSGPGLHDTYVAPDPAAPDPAVPGLSTGRDLTSRPFVALQTATPLSTAPASCELSPFHDAPWIGPRCPTSSHSLSPPGPGCQSVR